MERDGRCGKGRGGEGKGRKRVKKRLGVTAVAACLLGQVGLRPTKDFGDIEFLFENGFVPSKLQKDTVEFALPSLAVDLYCALYRMNNAYSVSCYSRVYPE